ncbi:MAG TPA: ABC transporter ATP-binding protein, partial [Candidatus Agrococcus pullicola]|nr:ABC transporter ATP-binding protein [Candidatus Agrococcus pullicola]
MTTETYTEQLSKINQQTGAPIRIAEVTKRYGDHVVLDRVSLDIRAGEFITLLGASGSGKSTLLNILAGFTKAEGGVIEVDGADISRKPPHKRGLGMVFQHYALFPHMTVFDNIAYGLRRQRKPRAEVNRLVGEVLDMIQMRQFADRKPSQLSGGQQQRVALARAIVFRPRVLLMDEPLGALDKLLREEMQLEIRRIHQELGITFIFVTHDQHEALTMSDRIALLRDGEIVQLGTPRELYSEPNSQYVAEFVGESNLFEGEVVDGRFVDAENNGTYGVPDGDGDLLLVRPEHVRVTPFARAAEEDRENTLTGR